ncbi:efflux transporter outer membrane subunit [Telmatospirillum sp.]|uniref:efflux transporter outer membrane subunit n=1 Tax=Telmatospirillum sp. TaxID=2079197 RepID=UPI00284ABBDF|nr:efflux transporter outer membrane subunit [Telmatospirillum sp.]MDR3435364.1 efflux transporter outer membrane subunit [Telmatospirillum sp.]
MKLQAVTRVEPRWETTGCRQVSRAFPVTLSALAIMLTACTVGPDYQAPDTTLAPFHNTEAVDRRQTDTPAPPLDQWWTGFSDPELTRIVQRVLAQNLDLQASLERVAMARASARSAGARLFPTIDATSQAEAARQSLESPMGALGRHFPGFDRDGALYDVGANASWEIDLAGGLRRGVEATEAEAEAAEATHLGVRVSVAADAADAYFQIRGYQARLRVAQEQIATDSHLLDLVRLRREKGIANDREVAESEALLAGARATVPPLRIGLEGQMNRLDVLMGAQPGTYGAERTEPADIGSIPAVSSQPVDLLRRRPDVIAAERTLAAATARIGVAVADYYPKLSLSGLLGFESRDVSTLVQGRTFQPSVVAGLRWRIFDFGKVDAEVAQADAATKEALAKYRLTVLHAAEDVENGLATLVQQEAQAALLDTEVQALTRARDRSQEAYVGGMNGLIDVLDADRQLLEAKDALVRSKADRARAATAVFRALGGGWPLP